MIAPLVTALAAFALSYVGLSLVEKLIHKITKNPDQSYKIGVWLFSILIAIYVYLTSIGR